jgi:hypothetical protein
MRLGQRLRERFDMEWEIGQGLLSKLSREAAYQPFHGQLREVRRLGGGRIFLAAVADKSGIAMEDGDWLDFLKRIIEWLMSEEGQAFIQMIIDLVKMIIGLF